MTVTRAAALPPHSNPGGGFGRGAKAPSEDLSSDDAREDAVRPRRVFGAEMDVAHVGEHGRTRFETSGQRGEADRFGTAVGAMVSGDEPVGALALTHEAPRHRLALHPLPEEASHEERVITDALPHLDLTARVEVGAVRPPRELDFAQAVGQALEPVPGDTEGPEVTGGGEARQQVSEIAGRAPVGDVQVREAGLEGFSEQYLQRGRRDARCVHGWLVASSPWLSAGSGQS